MSSGATNKIVTSTVNIVSWEISRSSYEAAKKKILSLQQLTTKPAKALEQAQKRTAQSEGKSALEAARAQTQRLKMAQKLSLEQQRQAQAQAKIAKQEEAHARKMQALNAKGQAQQLADSELIRRQNARLAAISAKVQAAARSRAMTYNPDIGGRFHDPVLVARQNAAMNRSHGAVAADIAATKRAMALEEKRQREKEASLKRQTTAYDTLRRASLTISHIEGASLADKMKAVQAIKEATRGYSEQRYTIAEMRHELAKATLETRRQARINRQIVKDKAKAERAGRINAQRLRGERSERGYGGLAAAGIIGGGSLIGSMGVARVGQTLQGSLERSREAQQLRQYDISQLEFNAIHDVVQKRTGYDLTVDRYASMNKDYFEKAGELLNTGSFKTNKHGVTTFSGGGELADLVNAVLSKTNQRTAQKVIGELQGLDMGTFVTYVRQLGKQFRWSENSMRHFLEAIDDGSVLLSGLTGEGDEVIARMHQLASEGWTLSDAQQANLDKLSALGVEYARVQESLGDHFSSSFITGLQDYAANTDTLRQNMTGLIPISDALGVALGELTTNILSYAGRVGEELKKGATLPDAVYTSVVDDSANGAADWIKEKTGFDPRSIGQTLKQIYPWLDSSASSSIGSGTAYNVPALALNVPGLNYLTPQQPTFTVPTIDSMTQRQPIPVSVTGQAEIKLSPLDVNVNDGAINGLIDTKLRSYEQAQNNMILGIAQ